MSLRTRQSEAPGQRSFNRGDADFAIALHGMAVAAENSAPSLKTGNNTVVPATSSLLSILPPMARGMTDVTRPQFGGGATPITPKNGLSGSLPPQGSCTVLAFLSIGRICNMKSGKSSGSVPSKRDDEIEAPVLPQHDVENIDLQNVAGVRALDIDRAGQEMRARPPLGAIDDRTMLGKDLITRFGRQRWRSPETVSIKTSAARRAL